MTRIRTVLLGSAALAIVVALVLADRAAASAVERRLADRLRCATGASGPIEVDTGGFPILDQLAFGELTMVEIEADTVPLAGGTVTHIEARATKVRLSDDRPLADSVTLFAQVSYPDLRRFTADRPDLQIIGGNESGRLLLRTDMVSTTGTTPATVYADVSVQGNLLTIQPAEVELPALGQSQTVIGRVPMAVSPAETMPMPQLPRGLKYRAAGATPEGMQFLAVGANLPLAGTNC